VVGSSIDKEDEAVACEIGIRYPTLLAIYAGKLNKQSIQVIFTSDIIYDIISCYMISYMISDMFQVPALPGGPGGNICWTDGQCCMPSFYRKGVLGRASSQASPCGYPSRATKSFAQ
jgi:hypothetical protein